MIDSADKAACLDALQRLSDAAQRIYDDANTANNGWSQEIGAGSSVDALYSDASSTLTLWQTMFDKYNQHRDSWTHLDAAQFVADCNRYSGTRTADASADQLQPSTAAEQVATDTAKDVVGDIVDGVHAVKTASLWALVLSPFVLIGAAVLLFLVYVPRPGRASR